MSNINLEDDVLEPLVSDWLVETMWWYGVGAITVSFCFFILAILACKMQQFPMSFRNDLSIQQQQQHKTQCVDVTKSPFCFVLSKKKVRPVKESWNVASFCIGSSDKSDAMLRVVKVWKISTSFLSESIQYASFANDEVFVL